MSSMDKRAALVWLIAVASAIGLWVLMTGGPALAEKMLVEICVEEGSYLNLRAGPGLAYDVEMELGPGNRLIVLETRGEWALVVNGRIYCLAVLEGAGFEDILREELGGETLDRPSGDYTVYRRPTEVSP